MNNTPRTKRDRSKHLQVHWKSELTPKNARRVEVRWDTTVVPVVSDETTPILISVRSPYMERMMREHAARLVVTLPKAETVLAPATISFWSTLISRRTMGVRSLVVLLIIMLNATGLTGVGETAAHFMDEETSTNNTYIAGLVDFELHNNPFTPTSTAENLLPGTSTAKYIDVIPNPLTNPFQYFASSSNFGVDLNFCSDLDATIAVASTTGTTTLYTGKLSGLLSATTTVIAPWYLTVSLPATSTIVDSICTFNTDFNAWQTRNGIPEYGDDGFSDTETVAHRVQSDGIRINKIFYDIDEEVEQEKNKCEALSPGFWANHDGCHNGSGASNWWDVVVAVSTGFSGVFSATSANGMCKALVTNQCPNGGTLAGKKCRAKRHLLTNEFNVASARLHLDALIAGADNGDPAFDHLGLSSTSTVRKAITVGEEIIANPASTAQNFTDLGTVMERIYSFYENENPDAPFCAYDPSYLPTRGEEPANEWVELYNQTNIPIPINSWQLCDNNACETLFASATSTIPGHGYALVTGASSTWDFWNVPSDMVRIIIPDGAIGDGLDNDADMLTLKRPDALPVDQMNYGVPNFAWPNANAELWDPGVPDVAPGHMLGRKPSGFDTNQPSDWVEYIPPHAEITEPTNSNDDIDWWNWGETHDIKWIATNGNGPDSDLLIDIYYIEDTDFSTSISTPDTVTPIALNSPNDGVESWTVPTGFTGWVWIQLLAKGPENPLINTLVTSGKIWDPPQFINELWGLEQETIPALEEEEAITEEDAQSEEASEEVAATSSDIILGTIEGDATTTDASSEVTPSTTQEVSGGGGVPTSETPGALPPTTAEGGGGVQESPQSAESTTTESTSEATSTVDTTLPSARREDVTPEQTLNEILSGAASTSPDTANSTPAIATGTDPSTGETASSSATTETEAASTTNSTTESTTGSTTETTTTTNESTSSTSDATTIPDPIVTETTQTTPTEVPPPAPAPEASATETPVAN